MEDGSRLAANALIALLGVLNFVLQDSPWFRFMGAALVFQGVLTMVRIWRGRRQR